MVVRVLAVGVVAASAAVGPARAAEYLGPVDVIVSKDAKTLYVANKDAKQVAVVDVAGGKVSGTIGVPAEPTGLALSPDGAKLYVTCAAPKSTVAVVDAKAKKVIASIPVGHSACAPAISPDGANLYVCNRFNNDVSVIDLAAGKEIARVAVTREPIAAAVSKDGATVLVANHLPVDPADGYDVAALVALMDTKTREVKNVRLPNGSSGLRGVCVAPDGKYAYVTHILARYQMPTTQLERGWMNTNALSVIDVAKKELLNTVLLDDVDLGGAVPWGVTCTADGKSICVTHGSTHELSVIDAAAMIEKLVNMPPAPDDDRGGYSYGTAAGVPNDLAFLVGLRRRIRLHGGGLHSPPTYEETTLNGPRGLAALGPKVYVAGYFTDNLGVVDLETKAYKKVTTIALAARPKLSVQRRGEMLFHDAHICFQHWQSCASCHPDARVDALNWDLMNDGLGNPKNVRSMLLAHKTPPSMSSGIRKTAEEGVRAGIKHIQFAVRPEEDAVAIDEYLKSLTPVPSPHLVDGQLSEAAKRGKALFDGKRLNCVKCHPAPLYTDLKLHDVGSKGKYDRRDTFDTPTLVEVWRTGPFMHDGKYTEMKEVFSKGKHGADSGEVEKLNEQELNDLVEYVLSL